MLFAKNFDWCGGRKQALAEYNWLVRLSLSKISYYSKLQVFRWNPQNICGLARFRSSWFYLVKCAGGPPPSWPPSSMGGDISETP